MTILHLPKRKLTNLKRLCQTAKSIVGNKTDQISFIGSFCGLSGNQLTSVKGLENLTELRKLSLDFNPDLTKAQIDELQKALPNCKINSNPTK